MAKQLTRQDLFNHIEAACKEAERIGAERDELAEKNQNLASQVQSLGRHIDTLSRQQIEARESLTKAVEKHKSRLSCLSLLIEGHVNAKYNAEVHPVYVYEDGVKVVKEDVGEEVRFLRYLNDYILHELNSK